MNTKDFTTALSIITQHHSTDIKVNHIESGASVGDVANNPTLHIVTCCGAVVTKLKEANFSLSMSNGMMSVTKL